VPALPTALCCPAQSKDAPAATDPYWTLDRVANAAGYVRGPRRLLKSGLSEPDYTALRDTFDALNVTADDPATSRKLRRLIIPRDVTIFYWGQKIDNTCR